MNDRMIDVLVVYAEERNKNNRNIGCALIPVTADMEMQLKHFQQAAETLDKETKRFDGIAYEMDHNVIWLENIPENLSFGETTEINECNYADRLEEINREFEGVNKMWILKDEILCLRYSNCGTMLAVTEPLVLDSEGFLSTN